jgi:hypothetical protein
VCTHLVIASFDPLLVKVMSPKVTLVVIHRMWFPAVGAPGDVRAWGAFGGGGHRGGSLGVTLTASRKDAMMVLAVWAQAYRTPELRGATRRRGVTPSPASRAQQRARIGSSCPEVRGVLPKLDSLPDEALGPGPRHRVRDVEIDSAGVGLGGVSNHPRGGLKDDEAGEPRLPNLRHDPLRGDARVAYGEEWHVNQLQIRRQCRQRRIDMISIGVVHPSHSPDLQQVTVGGDSGRNDRVAVARDNRRLHHQRRVVEGELGSSSPERDARDRECPEWGGS